jgi:uncharacterized protein (TIGR02001 family)
MSRCGPQIACTEVRYLQEILQTFEENDMTFIPPLPPARKQALACVIGCALAGTSLVTLANEGPKSPHTFSANVALATEYVFRGVTQSNEDPAIQGGMDYSHASGFYVGAWASNIEFNAGTSDAASIEIDVYGGFAGEFSNGIGWDIGGLYYWYPGQNEDSGGGDYDFVEMYGSLSYTFDGLQFEPSVEGGFAYTPDFYGEDGDGVYIHTTLGLSLPGGFAPYLTVGYQDAEGDKTNPTGYDDYIHYAVGMSKELGMFTADLSWHDAYINNCNDFCEAVVFSVSSSW